MAHVGIPDGHDLSHPAIRLKHHVARSNINAEKYDATGRPR